MGISSLLDVANTSLNAQRLALEVTGENITNVNTPGYSRQTAIMETAETTVINGHPMGNGVKVAAILRSYDGFLQGQLMTANASNGQATTSNSALQMVQMQFGDLTGSGLGTSIQGFFTAFQDLAANPQGVAERQAVLARGQEVVDGFHRISTYLTDVKTNMNQSLEGLTSDINDQLNQVATLNAKIKQVEVMGKQANEMRDQRDLLLRQLSQNVGVTFVEQTDGTVNVSLSSGQALVTADKAAALSLQTDAGTGYYDVLLTPPEGGAAVAATSFIGGPGNSQGKLGGTLQIRDTTINGYLSSLDELASTLADRVNAVQSAGYGLSGSTGVNFFTTSATAATIGISITSASDIAAADADPASGGTGNNRNAQSIASIYDTATAMTGGTMTMADFYTSVVGRVGVDVQAVGRAETQTGSMLKQLDNLREGNSGVSLDEELANLIKYQKAYQGAAKVINVGTEMLDTVLSLIR